MYSVNKYKVKDQEFTFIEVIRSNIKITFMDYGATIMSIFIPDKNGIMETILLAYKSLESYINNDMYLNAIIGPNSGRIKNASYMVNNEEVTLEKNFLNSENLHSGTDCFAFKFFNYEIEDFENETKIIFKYNKRTKDSISPGNQEIKIIYTITDSSLLTEFIGTTDKDSLLNMTNHAYFNLSGNFKDFVLNHSLEVNASNYIELDDKFVPCKVRTTENTIFDFMEERIIKGSYKQGVYDLPTLGIDHPFIFDDVGFEYKQVTLKDPLSGRVMEIYTTYPCAVIYTHNYPNDEKLLFGVNHEKHLGICFETQNEPNGINIKGLNNSILRKNERYYHKTLYKFGLNK